MSLRITGGEARGRSIASPAGQSVRPTASKIRQALFNMLASRIRGANFLDLFAGTGLMGIEALSRGAAELTSVELDKKLAQNITVSLEKLAFQPVSDVIVGDVRQVLAHLPHDHFDLIFADPPYKSDLAKSVLHLVDRYNLLKAKNGLLVIEHNRETKLPIEDVKLITATDSRQYGQTSLSFFKRDVEESGVDKPDMLETKDD